MAVVQEAYVAGVSTRKVDQVVESLGLRVSRSEVSRVCEGLDEQVEAFRSRPLEGRYPYLWLDAKVEKVRDGGRVVRKCLVIAHGVHESGRREVIGMAVGECESEAFWREFLRSLRARGLAGVRLCVSDAHAGLRAAIAKVLSVPWQRCTVHFLRDCLGHARAEQQPMLAALIRPIFNQDDRDQARDRLSEAVAHLEGKLPKVASLLEDAEEEVLAFYAFPHDHRRKIRSTDEKVKGREPSLETIVAVRLRVGRGRPPSKAQDLGLIPAAQLAPQRALTVAPQWRRPRPAWRAAWPASRRRADDTRARPAPPAHFRAGAPPSASTRPPCPFGRGATAGRQARIVVPAWSGAPLSSACTRVRDASDATTPTGEPTAATARLWSM